MSKTPAYLAINANLIEQFKELENEIYERKSAPNKIEAKIFYDYLISIHERLVSNEIQAEQNMDYKFLSYVSNSLRDSLLKILRLRTYLMEILSKAEPSPSTATNQSQTVLNLDSQLRKQNFLMKQVDSLEICDNHCPVRADVLYHHLNRLYDLFVSNQLEIEAQVDETTLEKQQEIATEFQRKIIDSQIKLKKIMALVVCTPSMESTKGNQFPQTIQTNAAANFVTLLKKAESLIQEMTSLVQQPMGEIGAEKAEELYHRYVSFDNLFVSNQNKIGSEFNCAILNSLLEASKKLKQKEIDLQTRMKQTALSDVPSSSTQLDESSTTLETEPKPEPESVILAEELKTISNLVAKFDALIESMWNKSEIGSIRSV